MKIWFPVRRFVMLGNIKYPIALSGKASSGKDTVAKIIVDLLYMHRTQVDALANPMKHIIQIMFPQCSEECLFGASEYRSTIISEAYLDKNGHHLTYRQALLDIGAFARSYNKDIWLHALVDGAKKDTTVHIISDVRYRNEFDFFKKRQFTMIRIKRTDHTKIDDPSETEQDGISDDEFDYTVDNNSTLENLQNKVSDIILHLQKSAV